METLLVILPNLDNVDGKSVTDENRDNAFKKYNFVMIEILLENYCTILQFENVLVQLINSFLKV